ncbi:MAG: glycosyltransferase family 4 protein [Myxococcales bacterium]|nr:glycosyltransferase family 4 protein [Myxococcales bacterium]
MSVVTSSGPSLTKFGADNEVQVTGVPMRRAFAPLSDLVAVARLVALMRRSRPDIVHAHTPKGGLLGMIAATIAGVPARIYHMRGLPFVTAKGARRRILRMTERVATGLSKKTICVSHSLREVAIRERVASSHKLIVLASGSGNGVDAEFLFNPDRVCRHRERLRHELDMPVDSLVVGFVGRLVLDKGLRELAVVWRQLRENFPTARLLIVGPEEERDAAPLELLAEFDRDRRVSRLGQRKDMPDLYAAMDVVVLPSHREGFPNVPLEAAAMGLPVVTTDVPGCRDAVEDGATGTLVPVGNVAALQRALEQYLRHATLRQVHGLAGRERVLREFNPRRIWTELTRLYDDVLDAQRGAPHSDELENV